MVKALIRITIIGFVATMVIGMVGALMARRRAGPPPDPADDEINIVMAFEQLAFRSRAAQFQGGRVELWYAGGALDLREATLAPGGAHLVILAIFGGGQLAVPESWNVTIENRAFAGGFMDTRPDVPRPDDAPLLTIEALTFFGGFQVTSALPEAVEQQFVEAALA